jgi:hypothetical protein
MRELTLPVLPAGMSIGKALQRMNAAGTSGCVTRVAGIPAVIDVDALRNAAKGNISVIGGAKPTLRSVKLPAPLRGMDASTHDALEMHEASFGIGGTGGGQAQVISIQEGVGAPLEARASYWQCRKNKNHIFAPGTLIKTGFCNHHKNVPVDLVS